MKLIDLEKFEATPLGVSHAAAMPVAVSRRAGTTG
jgi:hypothetical protein